MSPYQDYATKWWFNVQGKISYLLKSSGKVRIFSVGKLGVNKTWPEQKQGKENVIAWYAEPKAISAFDYYTGQRANVEEVKKTSFLPRMSTIFKWQIIF